MTTVLVTGASGFIAKHIVRELLEHDYTVKAAVRSERRQAQVVALFPDANLSFVSLDLTSDDGWTEAMAGVDVLMHTASPFPLTAPKDPQEIIKPAVDGTLRALNAAHAAGVTRVIVTSSCAAIHKDPTKAPMAVATRENWTDPSWKRTTPYEASKTLAERAAWDFVKAHPEIRLTTINPGLVVGPPMDSDYGTSLEIVQRMLNGSDPMYPKANLPIVDVRDVARMHVAAIDNDAAIGQRFPANAGALYFAEIAGVLAKAYPDKKIPTRTAPDLAIRLAGAFTPAARTAATSLGLNLDVDATDAPAVMGFSYIPTPDAILASARYLTANSTPSA